MTHITINIFKLQQHQPAYSRVHYFHYKLSTKMSPSTKYTQKRIGSHGRIVVTSINNISIHALYNEIIEYVYTIKTKRADPSE